MTSKAGAQHPAIARLLHANAQWARDVTRAEPAFFKNSAKGQTPKIFWIGCADSRVPESVVLACRPGDLFVHRNIANQFYPDDESALAALQYAVDFVGVNHIIIAGHTNCGGAAACYAAATGNPGPIPSESPLGQWLERLTQLAKDLQLSGGSATKSDGEEVKVEDVEAKEKAELGVLVEENVKIQVENIANSKTMIDAWAADRQVYVHGWMYTLETGLVRDLNVSRGPKGENL